MNECMPADSWSISAICFTLNVCCLCLWYECRNGKSENATIMIAIVRFASTPTLSIISPARSGARDELIVMIIFRFATFQPK